jgi:hypothetical protein
LRQDNIVHHAAGPTEMLQPLLTNTAPFFDQQAAQFFDGKFFGRFTAWHSTGIIPQEVRSLMDRGEGIQSP